jgi:hypothetical protein
VLGAENSTYVSAVNAAPGTRSYEHSPDAQYSYYLDGYGYEAEDGREPQTLSARQTRFEARAGRSSRLRVVG